MGGNCLRARAPGRACHKAASVSDLHSAADPALKTCIFHKQNKHENNRRDHPRLQHTSADIGSNMRFANSCDASFSTRPLISFIISFNISFNISFLNSFIISFNISFLISFNIGFNRPCLSLQPCLVVWMDLRRAVQCQLVHWPLLPLALSRWLASQRQGRQGTNKNSNRNARKHNEYCRRTWGAFGREFIVFLSMRG